MSQGPIGIDDLGYDKKLYVLAFDHRGSFEKMVGDVERVPGAKSLIWEGFQRAVAETLREVPRGEVIAYGELAALAGYPNAQRAVGTDEDYLFTPLTPKSAGASRRTEMRVNIQVKI